MFFFLSNSLYNNNKLKLKNILIKTIITKSNQNNINNLILNTKIFLFDCDGVIWRGNEPIKDSINIINNLKYLNKKLFFITNNSTKSRNYYYQKFINLGYNVNENEIFSSSYAASLYLKQLKRFDNSNNNDNNNDNNNKTNKVYVIGEEGICDELKLNNINYIDGSIHNDIKIDINNQKDIEIDENIGAVVVGMDRNINYYKLQYAQLCLSNPNTLFIATNEDAVAHCTTSQLWCAGGTMVSAIKGCTNRLPIVVGKPSSFLFDYLLNEYHVDRSEICMIGDRLDTDILFGNNNNINSLLVLSGVTSLEMLSSPSNKIHPNYCIDSIADLIEK